ncbi:MAG TPA: ISKra4 family transposase [Chloroflexota bacterium]|nr:ISKra4 family transposase [Chloroflexota bacterium]
MLARLGTWLPFPQAAREFAWFTGVAASEPTARRRTEAAGAAALALQEAELARLERERPPAPAGPRVQLLSADGAMVGLVGGAWGEVKTAAVGVVEVGWDAAGAPVVRTTALSYVSRLADVETFTRAALPELHRRGTETAGTVLAPQDGGAWPRSFVDHHRSDAVRILDFAHAVEHLNAAVQASLGVGTAAATARLGAQAHELRHGDPDAVLADLRALPVHDAADPAAAAAARDATLGYLQARRDQIDYARFAALGFPIGSGAVESANKLVVEARLKGAGMRWAPSHVDPMLALRGLACNDRWDETWPAIARLLRTPARARPARRCAPRGLSAHQASRPVPHPRPPRPPRAAPMPRPVDAQPSSRSWRHAFQPARRAADLAATRAARTTAAKS